VYIFTFAIIAIECVSRFERKLFGDSYVTHAFIFVAKVITF